ncbi:FG-GAP-like repeat-containing protein [Streptomyces lincolnensis]|uniref:FG-GAP-like repeat-containing protein n=1 Tax=Streptomyces lincolnensis TaxID=1915 RepID=UPI001E401E42|nr:FG-GAP-like repeat-containing protein [Streptomyces lincolnensis]MCD7437293.1 FG-GAP-like repeat-containing protein [Streptomyces lincolnensis]
MRTCEPQGDLSVLVRRVLRLGALAAGIVWGTLILLGGTARAETGPDGAYATSIPIAVPAFRGLEPEVSLSYGSDAPNGLAGPGWGLSATSHIVRAGSGGGTPVYDDAADVFVLDGTELVPCTQQKPRASPSCSSGGTHSTRQENYTRILKEGDSWVITAKNGTRSIYTAQHIGSSAVTYQWALSRRVDTHGNEVTYDYSCDGVRECYLTRISYGNSPDALKSAIVFFYELRPDVTTYATGQKLGILAKRLRTIEVDNAGSLVRVYGLSYRAQSGPDRVLLEKVQQWGNDAVVAADGAINTMGTTPLPARTFRAAGSSGWTPGVGHAHFTGPWPNNGGVPGQKDWNGAPLPGLLWQQDVRVQWFPCDFDADGRQDMLGVGREDNGRASVRVAQAQRDGTWTSRTQLLSWDWGNASRPQWRAMPGDVTGDGRCDLAFARWDPTVGRVLLTTAVSQDRPTAPFRTVSTVQTAVDEWAPQSRWFLADTNGDHRADVMAALHHRTTASPPKDEARFFVALSTGRGGLDPHPVTDPHWTHNPRDAAHWFVGDFDGDDRADLAHVRQNVDPNTSPKYQAAVDLALSLGDGTFKGLKPFLTGANWVNSVDQPDLTLYGDVGTDLVQSGDFNSDGRTDLLVVGEKPLAVVTEQPKLRLFTLLSTGRGAFRVVRQDTTLPLEYTNLGVSFALQEHSYPNHWISGDTNGDTATDVAILAPTSYRNPNWPSRTRATWLISKKDGTFQAVHPAPTDWTHDCPDRSSGVGNRIVCPEGLTGQYFLTDISGDGRADLTGVFPHTAQNNMRIASFRVKPTWNTDGQDTINWHDADVNGDGAADRVFVKYTNPGLRIYTALRNSTSFNQLLIDDVLPAYDDRAPGRCLTIDVGGPQIRADGKADLVCPYAQESRTGASAVRIHTLLSDGTGQWTPAPGIAGTAWPGATFEDTWSLKALDVDGDGDTDLAHTAATASGVMIRTLLSAGNGQWTAVNEQQFGSGGEDDGAAWRVADVNGDKQADLVHVHFTGAATQEVRTLLSRGDGHWLPLTDTRQLPSTDTADWKPAQLNPDGKTDLLSVESLPPTTGPTGVTGHLRIDQLVSRGRGTWDVDSVPVDINNGAGPGDSASWRITDLDGDGVSDLTTVTAAASGTELHVWTLLNRHGSWAVSHEAVPAADWDLGVPVHDTRNMRPTDENADGRDDLAIVRKDADTVRFLALRSRYDDGRLVGHTNELGGSVEVQYRSSTGTHASMPAGSVRRVVAAVRTFARPAGPSAAPDSTTAFRYEGARWSAAEHRFLGFATVTATNEYSRTVTDYAQTPGCAKARLKVAISETGGGAPSDTTTYTYDDSSTKDPPPHHCRLLTERREQCEADGCRTLSTQYAHDQYGNITSTRRDGLFADSDHDNLDDIRKDNREQTVLFKPNITAYIVGLPAAIEVLDTSGAQPLRVTRSQVVYDTNTAYTQPPLVGDLAKLDVWDSVRKSYATTTVDHDSYGNPTKVTGPTGRWSRTDYDTVYGLYPVQKCNATYCEGQEWNYSLGKPTVSRGPDQQTTTRRYEPHGRIRHVDYPGGGCEDYQYPGWGTRSQRVIVKQCLSASNADLLGLPIEQYVDGLGRTILLRRASGAERTLTYFAATDRVETESAWATPGSGTATERYTYDYRLRARQIQHADGSHRSVSFGNNTETYTDELKHDRVLFRDGFDNVERVREFVTITGQLRSYDTTFTYDALDRLVETVDARKNTTTTQWDSLGRRHGGCDPDLGCWTIGYDDQDHLPDWQVDAKKQRLEFRYDQLGRLTEKVHDPQGTPRSDRWFYDIGPLTSKPNGASTGRITRTENADGTATHDFTYDTAGHVTLHRICVQLRCAETEAAYDAPGRLASVRYPDQSGTVTATSELVTYTYDPAGRLESVGGYVSSLGYDTHDRLERLRYANDTEAFLTYDPHRQWISTERVEDLAHNELFHSTYGHDLVGRTDHRVSRNPNPEKQNFRYDELNRLLEVTGAHAQSFEYDELGNMISHSQTGTYRYDDPHHVHAVTEVSGQAPATYAYDANGNQTTGVDRTLGWTDDNLLASATTPAGKTTFVYDADGDRVRKTGPNGTVDTLGPLVEFDAAGQMVTSYYAGPRLIATRRGNDVSFHHQDVLGSPRMTTDASGTVTARSNYAPYGAPHGPAGQAGSGTGFAGHKPDDETGLIHMGSRYYDPELAKFVSADTVVPRPYDPQALNRYSYAYNAPLDYTDPDGHEPIGVHQRIESEDFYFEISVNVDPGWMPQPYVVPTWAPPQPPTPSIQTPVDVPLRPNSPAGPPPSPPTGTTPGASPSGGFEPAPGIFAGISRAAALEFAVGAARLGALGIVLWSTPAGDPATHARFLAQQDVDRIIREPLKDWVPIGEETQELPVLDPVPHTPADFPSDRATDPYDDPALPGGPTAYDLANGWEKHHVFPQTFASYFKQKGIDIHDFTVSIGVEQHKAIHRAGWNAEWFEIVTSPGYGALTPADVLKIGERMKRKYGIVGPYERY